MAGRPGTAAEILRRLCELLDEADEALAKQAQVDGKVLHVGKSVQRDLRIWADYFDSNPVASEALMGTLPPDV